MRTVKCVCVCIYIEYLKKYLFNQHNPTTFFFKPWPSFSALNNNIVFKELSLSPNSFYNLD